MISSTLFCNRKAQMAKMSAHSCKRIQFVLSLSSSDLIITAAAQVVGRGGIRVGRRRRCCHFLRHAGVVRRIFQHIVQAAVRPVVRGRLQPQQVWDRARQTGRRERRFVYKTTRNIFECIFWEINQVWLYLHRLCEVISYIKTGETMKPLKANNLLTTHDVV